jgi:LPXTG-motif cell wall-anchored protein
MTTQNKSTQSSSALARTGRAGLHILLVGTLVFSPSLPASATTTYAVPAGGLSFDANGALEANPCTTGFGNSLSYATGETDEVNGLIAGEFLTYRNVATIGGQAIDAKVTLTAISGMRAERSASVLDRLDKCDADADAGLLEMNFDSATVAPGDANFTITIDFLAGGNPATLTNLVMNVEDIDSDQYLEVDNFTSARLASGRTSSDLQEYENGEIVQLSGGSTATLSTTATARRFLATGSSSSSDTQTEQDKHVAEITYASVSSLVLKLGVYKAGGGSFDLNFSGFTFVDTPEVLTATPAPTPTPTPTPTPVVAAPQLARTGAGEESVMFGFAGITAILIAVGSMLLYRRRKLS